MARPEARVATPQITEIAPYVPSGLELGLRNYWYPILQSEEVGRDQPVGLTCLGESLAVWRDGDGHPHTLVDRCLHRGARLSVGRVLAGQLQCAFHGLRFDGEGRCVLLPWEPDEAAPAHGLRVQAYPTGELGGYIWAYLGDADRFPPPPLEDEVPQELLDPETFGWFRMPTEVWETNWLVAIDGSDAYHAVTLHAETQAVADVRWDGGRPAEAGVALADRRLRFTRASYGLRAISTDRHGTPIHHGHVLETKGDRFVLPCLTTTPIRPVPGVEPYVPRLWQFPIDERRTMVVRYLCQRARTPEERARWEQLFRDVVRPRIEGISREDAMMAAAQGDLANARGREHLFFPDADMVQVRERIRDAYLSQARGERIGFPREALAYPV
jgi:nitrite reductase/ring-hydroxylating ferredoxin subunit